MLNENENHSISSWEPFATSCVAAAQKACLLALPRITLPRRAVRARLAESYAWVGEQELLAGASHDSRRHLWRSVRLDPANPHRVMALLCTFLPSPVFLAANRGRKALRALVGLTGAGSLLP